MKKNYKKVNIKDVVLVSEFEFSNKEAKELADFLGVAVISVPGYLDDLKSVFRTLSKKQLGSLIKNESTPRTKSNS